MKKYLFPLLLSGVSAVLLYFVLGTAPAQKLNEFLHAKEEKPFQKPPYDNSINELSMTLYTKEFAEKYNLPPENIAELDDGMELLEFYLVKNPTSNAPTCFFNFLLRDDVPIMFSELVEEQIGSYDLNTLSLHGLKSANLQIEPKLPERERIIVPVRGYMFIATDDRIFDVQGAMFDATGVYPFIPQYLDGLNYVSESGACSALQKMAQYKGGTPSIWFEKPEFKELLAVRPRPKREDGYQEFHYIFRVPPIMEKFIVHRAPTGAEIHELIKPYKEKLKEEIRKSE